MAKSILAPLYFNYMYRKQNKFEHVDRVYQLKYLSLGNKSLQYVHQENLPALETFLAAISSEDTRLQDPWSRAHISVMPRVIPLVLSPTPARTPSFLAFALTACITTQRQCADRDSALNSAYRMRHSACT